MKQPETIPDGFEWRAADPVEALYIGDECATEDGRRFRFIGAHYPCERRLIFQGIGPTHEIVELPLSEASAMMRPTENRVEGLGYFELKPPK